MGITAQDIKLRWAQHVYGAKRHITNKFGMAIQQYGAEDFEVVPLYRYTNRFDALHAENTIVGSLDLMRHGYNSTPGGEDNPMLDPAIAAKVAAKNKGKIVPPEVRAKIAASHKGRPNSLQHNANISAANKGKVLSAETRQRLSSSRKFMFAQRRDKWQEASFC